MAADGPVHVLTILRGFALDGPGRLALALLRAFDPARLRVSAVSLSGDGPLRDDMDRELRRLGGSLVIAPSRWTDLPRTAAHIASLAERWRAEALHAHLLRPDAAGRMASRRCGVPLLLTEHGIHYWSLGGAVLRPVVRAWYVRSLRKTRMQVAAVSSKVCRELVREGVPRKRIVTIPNGIDLPPSPNPGGKAAAREALSLSDVKGPVLVCVGGLTENKRFDLAIRTVYTMRRMHSVSEEPLLLICGDGPERRRLEQLSANLAVRENPSFTPGSDETPVRFLGGLTDPSPVYTAADLLIHPSLQESFSLVVAEASAHGLPALTRAGSGADLTAPPWPLGVAVHGDLPELWARSALSLLNARPDAGELRRFAERRFTISRCAVRYTRVFYRVAQR